MSTIWMDPPEMHAATSMLSEQAYRVQETITGTRTACACAAPRSLIGWLDAELQAISAEALLVAVGYVLDALDTELRAQEIEADQSLAVAQAGVVAPHPSLVDAILGATVVGGTTTPGLGALSASFAPVGGVTDPGRAATDAMLTNMIVSSAGPSLADVMSRSGDAVSTILAPPGLTFSDGAFVDEGGDRSSSLAGEYRDPVTGEYDL